jgi:hypothetical protein
MALRIHGVIGGPRRKKRIRPRKKQDFFPKSLVPKVVVSSSKKIKKEHKVETFVDVSESDEIALLPAKDEIPEAEPTVEEETVEEAPEASKKEVPVDPSLTCPYCSFESKSARGLKSHIRWRHPATEVF